MTSRSNLEIPQERLDKRVLNKPFLGSPIGKERLEEHLKSLPDVSDNAVEFEIAIDAAECAAAKGKETGTAC